MQPSLGTSRDECNHAVFLFLQIVYLDPKETEGTSFVDVRASKILHTEESAVVPRSKDGTSSANANKRRQYISSTEVGLMTPVEVLILLG